MKKLKILIMLLVAACIIAPSSMYAFASKNLNNANEFIQQVEEKLNTSQENNEELSSKLDVAYNVIDNLQAEINKHKEPKSYTDEDLILLAKVMYHENGCDWFPNVIQLITGSIVLNRVGDEDYPNTIYDVVYQPGQYGCAWNGSFYVEPSERAIENARFLLENGSIIPENVIYQSGEPQGSGTYFTFYDPVLDVMQYFCYK